MKQVVNAKLTKGYEHWKSEFEESRKVRSEAGITIIRYNGHHKPAFMLSMISNPWKFFKR